MKFTYKWLKEYLETDKTPEEIAETLNLIGLEIEELTDTSENLKGFIVGEVKDAKKHPDADKLQVLTVNDGKENLQVVCGAPNARAGIKGIFASPGVKIPTTGDVLKKAKIRGVESNGMMCSLRELGLGEDHTGIIELPENINAKPGDPAEKVIPNSIIFDGEITPNRADYLGVKGIAKDLSAADMGTFKDRDIQPVKGTFKNPKTVDIKDIDACPMFVGRYIKNVKNCESPDWLKEKLKAIGAKSISALVDITNYVLFDMCRPLHVFDADKLRGNLTIRLAKKGEKILALDEEEYTLTEEDIVIADENGVQSLAGVMGGLETGCQKETQNVFLESALFNAVRIRKTGTRHKIISDARYRFERYIDPKSTLKGIEYATKLILDICGGEASELVIAGEEPKGENTISYNPKNFNKKIGIEIDNKTQKEILEKLDCRVTEKSETEWNVISPSTRGDFEEEHDLIEEVIRIYGYNKVPARFPEKKHAISQVLTPKQKFTAYAKRTLANRGFFECITWAFMDKKIAEYFSYKEHIELENPISSDLDVMRKSIIPNLTKAVYENNQKGYFNLSLFETGAVFTGTNPQEQTYVITGIRSGNLIEKDWRSEKKPATVFDIKADMEAIFDILNIKENIQVTTENLPKYFHPYKSGAVFLGKNLIANFGELHPRVLKNMDAKEKIFAFEIFVDKLPITDKKKISKNIFISNDLQSLTRDFAFVGEKNLNAAELIKVIKKTDKQITDVKLFDIFIDSEGSKIGKDKISLAVKVTIQPKEKTLSENEIAELTNSIIKNAENKLNVKLRDK